MTYRSAVQIQIAALQQVYDNAEGLRDAATSGEREAWNTLRRQLPALWSVLQEVDNKMSDAQAKYELRGKYQVQIS